MLRANLSYSLRPHSSSAENKVGRRVWSSGRMRASQVVIYTRMIPIHELLNRIRWDPEFGRGDFQLGYYDRAEHRVILVPFKEVSFAAESPQTLQVTDAEGQSHRIPFHRVREVYRDSQRIWYRGESPR